MSTPNRIWTIEINGISRKFKDIQFDRKLDMNSPTDFTAKIEFSTDIHFFDTVVIKRDGVAEWKGYIEGIDISWDNAGDNAGRYLNLKGRDASVLLWKKYVDNFGSYTESGSSNSLTQIGFFGAVNPIELIKLLLRTPYSDQMFDPNNIPPSYYYNSNGYPVDIYGNVMASYPLIEEGWGIDSSRLLCSALNTGLGDPQWTILRRRGYGWRNGILLTYDQNSNYVNALLSNNGWHLTGSSPYLNDLSHASYIRSDQTAGHSITFTFTPVPPETTIIQNVFLHFDWYGDFYRPASIFSDIIVDIWVDTQQAWVRVDELANTSQYTDWREEIVDISAFIKTVQDATNCRIRFTEESPYYWTKVSNCFIAVNYTILGEQSANEFFNVKILRPPNQLTTDYESACATTVGELVGPFKDGTTWTCPFDGTKWVYSSATNTWTKQTSLLADYKEVVCGVYIESRMDNVSYPRNYKIVTDGNIIPLIGSIPTPPYTTVDANSHILSTKSDNTEIDFKSYPDEEAYNYQDYGLGGVSTFMRTFAFKIIQYQVEDYAATLFAIDEDILGTRSEIDSYHHFAVDIKGSNSGLFLRFDTFDGSSTRVTKYSTALYPTRMYYMKIVKDISTITWYLYDNADMKTPIYSDSSSYSFADRYIYNAMTYGGSGDFLQVFTYFFNNTFGFSGFDRVSSAPNIVPVIDMTRGLSMPSGNGSAEFISATADKKGWFEKTVEGASDLRTEFWLRVGDKPVQISTNKDLITNAFSGFLGSGWGCNGNNPFLDGIGSNYMDVTNDPAYLGSKTYYFGFDSLQNVESWVPSLIQIHLKGYLFNGIYGHGDSMSIRLYYSWDNWLTHFYVDVPQFTSTSSQEQVVTLPSLSIDNINKLQVKLEFSGYTGSHTGSGWGGLILTKMWTHAEGFGYSGRIMVAKIFDSNEVQNCPNYLLFCGMGLRANYDGNWHPYLFWDDNNGQYHELIDDTVLYSAGVPFPNTVDFKEFRLVVKQSSDIELWWYDGISAWHLIYTASPSNSTLGTPNCVCWCADCYNGASLPNGINFDQTAIDTVNDSWMTAEIIIDANQREEITLVPEVTTNTFRDIIHSWQPIAIDNLKIIITQDDAPDDLDNNGQHTGQDIRHGWAISQIYIYRADDIKYRVYLDGLTDPSTPPTTPDASYVYKGGPYIKSISIDTTPDDITTDVARNFGIPAGPLNVARQRLLDAILFVLGQCCLIPNTTDQAYVPFEWWIIPDTNNTFRIAQLRGSDKSVNVVFEKGVNCGGIDRNQFINDTCQRVFIVGQGEKKKQQEVSQWTENTDGEDDVRTFYEEIENEKSITDPSVSKLVGEVYTEKNAPRRDQITLSLTKDDYVTFNASDPTHGGAYNTYDCGDYVQVIDSLVGVNDKYRIMNVSKHINNNGEQITLTLGYPKYRYEDEMSTIYKQLKQFGAVGVIKPDWLADGSETTDINAYRIGATTQFSKNAKNDTVNQPSNPKDPLFWVAQDDIYSGRQTNYKDYDTDSFTPPHIDMDHGAAWYCANSWMALFGATSGLHQEYVTIKGPEDDATVVVGGVETALTTNYGPLYISIDRNPKVSFEIKCTETVNLTWATGDYVIVGLRNMAASSLDTTIDNRHTGNVGFWFMLRKESDGFIKAYAQYCIIPNSGGIADSDSNIFPKNGIPIKALIANHKYKFEIITDTDLGIVSFNIYDVEDTNNETMIASAIAPINTLSDLEESTLFVNPLFMEINSTGSTSGPNRQCKFYLYKYTTEWLKVTQAS